MIVVERAISLLQPWATLMATGVKRVETRSWNTNFRGWIAIHASKRLRAPQLGLCRRWGLPGDLPLGQVIAVLEVVACRSVLSASVLETVGAPEREFGDYTDGRWAIFTRSPRLLRQPIAMNGYLGIWRLPRQITEEDLLPLAGAPGDLSGVSCGPENSLADLAPSDHPKSQ